MQPDELIPAEVMALLYKQESQAGTTETPNYHVVPVAIVPLNTPLTDGHHKVHIEEHDDEKVPRKHLTKRNMPHFSTLNALIFSE